MQGHRLVRVLGMANVFQVKYEFVRVIGVAKNSERFYLTTSADAVSGYLKLKHDLGEDHFRYTTYIPMTLEEILALKGQGKIPQLTENLLGKVLLASVKGEDSVQLIGHKGAKDGNNVTRRTNQS